MNARPPRFLPAPLAEMPPAHALTALIPDARRTARAILRNGDLAEDVVQEALLRVWARLNAGVPIGDLRPYLMTTVRNLARRPRPLAPAEAAPPEAAPGGAHDRIACTEVLAALTHLPRDQARLLTVTALNGATLAELAETTGLPPGTVASRVSRARARLRAQFGLSEKRTVSDLLDG